MPSHRIKVLQFEKDGTLPVAIIHQAGCVSVWSGWARFGTVKPRQPGGGWWLRGWEWRGGFGGCEILIHVTSLPPTKSRSRHGAGQSQHPGPSLSSLGIRNRVDPVIASVSISQSQGTCFLESSSSLRSLILTPTTSSHSLVSPTSCQTSSSLLYSLVF